MSDKSFVEQQLRLLTKLEKLMGIAEKLPDSESPTPKQVATSANKVTIPATMKFPQLPPAEPETTAAKTVSTTTNWEQVEESPVSPFAWLQDMPEDLAKRLASSMETNPNLMLETPEVIFLQQLIIEQRNYFDELKKLLTPKDDVVVELMDTLSGSTAKKPESVKRTPKKSFVKKSVKPKKLNRSRE